MEDRELVSWTDDKDGRKSSIFTYAGKIHCRRSLLISPPGPPQPNFRLSVGLSDLGTCGAKMLGSKENLMLLLSPSSLPLWSGGQVKIGNPTSSFVSRRLYATKCWRHGEVFEERCGAWGQVEY
jgi:hypothetical protein